MMAQHFPDYVKEPEAVKHENAAAPQGAPVTQNDHGWLLVGVVGNEGLRRARRKAILYLAYAIV